MNFFSIAILVILALLVIFLAPRVINWLHTARCYKCGKWFCLEYHSFVVTDKVVGHHRSNSGWGRRAGWKGGIIWGFGRTKDDPFIREWGEARYICSACGRHISIHNVKRDR